MPKAIKTSQEIVKFFFNYKIILEITKLICHDITFTITFLRYFMITSIKKIGK